MTKLEVSVDQLELCLARLNQVRTEIRIAIKEAQENGLASYAMNGHPSFLISLKRVESFAHKVRAAVTQLRESGASNESD